MDERFIDMAERIAALETAAEQGKLDREELKTLLTAAITKVTHTDTNLNQLINKISRWEGKFGGVIFAFSCVWVFLTDLPGNVMDFILKLTGAK